MTVAWTAGLNQIATYWPPVGNDGYGGKRFGVPVVIACRWEDRIEVFRDAAGNESQSVAVIYVDRLLELRGMIMLGNHSIAGAAIDDVDPRPSAQALEIRYSGVSPSLQADMALHKVMV